MIVSEAVAIKKKFFDLPNDPDNASFEISVLAPSQSKKIEAKSRKIVATEAGNEMVFDTATAGSMRATDALTGWDNVFATPEDKAAGKVMPFTDINKRRLLNGVHGLEEFVLEKLMELTQEYEASKEKERKNFSSSVNG